MPTVAELAAQLDLVANTMGDFIAQQKAAQEKGLDTKTLDAKIVEQIKAQLAIEKTLASTGDLAKLELRVKGLERAPSRKRQIGRRATKRSRARAWAADISSSPASEKFIDEKDDSTRSSSATIKLKTDDPVTTDESAPDEWRDPNWTVEPAKVTRLRDLIPVINIDKGTYQFVRQSKYFYIYTNVATTVVLSAATPTAVDVGNAEAFKVGAIVYKDDAETDFGTITAVDRDASPNTITINSAAGFTATALERLWSKEFIWTREAKPKPFGKITYEVVDAKVRKISTVHFITDEALEDEPQLASEIENQVFPDMQYKEERQFYYGTGSNGEMTGFMNDTDIQLYSWSDGLVGDTKMDAVWRARGIARLNNTVVDAVTVSVQDNTDIAITKGEDGHYLTRVEVDSAGNVTAMGMMLLEADALDADDALTGSFGTGATIADRTDVMVKMFSEYEGAMLEDQVALRFRQRTILAVKRPKSFVRIKFDAAPEE